MITPAMKRYGLDERFNRFVVQMMVWTVLIGVVLLAIVPVIRGDERVDAGYAILTLLYGGVFAVAFALVSYAVWFRPSVPVFGRIFRNLTRRLSETFAAMIAGTVTALVGSIAFYVIATLIARDFDSIQVMIILFGPVSLFVAPLVAWRSYRNRATQPSQLIK